MAGKLTATMLAGGKSNLTYEITDGTSRWVLRRPPLGHVLPTAHDMGREYRVLSALRDTTVPVPVPRALCLDDSVIGAPFYLMDKVDGTSYRTAAALSDIGADRTRTVSERLIDTLTALHGIDPDDIGLADFGRPHGFFARQVARWRRQLEASHSRDLPVADDLYDRLAATVPPPAPPAIVHGDFRLDNVLVDDGDRLVAVIDWEMATIGDPLTDLALMIVYDRLARLLDSDVVSDVAAAPGYLGEAQIVSRYAARSGRDVSDLGLYIGLASFKLAAILEGIHYRHMRRETVGSGFDRVGDAVAPLLTAGLASVQEGA
ncbi:aminoglycoside phosphotransferase (APT) family kinase protein [Prauserella sediminis]|uniref:Aminoglycoside phosphotransferase (APT) family kinase protein n=1 Tax=Prauserella sediminis TaxID=577680 RepID=A0A839XR27_9PSEU|nr:aminoglycoside phosphotransferase (APT) family kinase protein [Prauserella sediminis]